MTNHTESPTLSTMYVMETAAYAYAADRWHTVLAAMKTRDQFPISSMGWLIHHDLVAEARAAARAATARAEDITSQIKTAPPAPLAEGWACTACGKPVRELGPGRWTHKSFDDAGNCQVGMLG